MDRRTAQSALLARIRSLIYAKGRAIVAIDGMSASGKTTLACQLAANLPSCAVVHMDDFTIPFENRYPGYFDSTLSNADIARFDREALTPLLAGAGAQYRPYRCHPAAGFLEPIAIADNLSCIIVEGAYCLHPLLFDRYDLRVLMTIGADAQHERILARNGQSQLDRFLSQWIPMENRHIDAHNLRSKCDVIIKGT